MKETAGARRYDALRTQLSLDEALAYVAESSREGAFRILEQPLAAASSLDTAKIVASPHGGRGLLYLRRSQ